MQDSECVEFLQWALPRLHMRWAGFRKVRGQICKRIVRRMRQLNIDNIAAYRDYLQDHPQEWASLDALSRVTISRFYRDKGVFSFLEEQVLPALAQQAIARQQDSLTAWSAGSGSGEEPYTIALMWMLRLQPIYPHMHLGISATDVDPYMNQRAKQACYPYSSIKDLPANWREPAFIEQDGLFCLKPEYRRGVQFIEQDLRSESPAGPFDLVLCRNLVFTYFEEQQQRTILDRIRGVIQSGGALIVGIDENLPEGTRGFSIWSDELRVFRKDIE